MPDINFYTYLFYVYSLEFPYEWKKELYSWLNKKEFSILRVLPDYQYILSIFKGSQLKGSICTVNIIMSILYNNVENLEIEYYLLSQSILNDYYMYWYFTASLIKELFVTTSVVFI